MTQGKALGRLKEDIVDIALSLDALKLVGYGLAAIGPGLGIGIACYGCCVATARQPELQGRLFTNFIIGAALAEALALLGFVLAFIL
jgi:F-type H+-transporting ATPase subunit c